MVQTRGLQDSLISGKTHRQREAQARICVPAARHSSQRAGEAKSRQIRSCPSSATGHSSLGAQACPMPSKELLSWSLWQGRFHLTVKLTCLFADRHCE